MPAIPLTWLNQITVNTATAGTQSDPDIVQLANGNILVTWTSSDNGGPGSPPGTEIVGQLFTPMGVRIGGEFRLNNASTSDNERNADLAALPNGGFVMVYHDVDLDGLGGSNIRLEEYDASGVAVTANTVVVADTGAPGPPNYGNPRVAVSSATSVLVVYEKGTWNFVAGKIYNPVTDTYSAEFPVINVFNGNNDPDVAVLTNGNYVVAASLTGTSVPVDSGVVFTILSGAGATVKLLTGVTGGGGANGATDEEPSVTALAGGGFVISWVNTGANDTDVLFRVFDAAGTDVGGGVAATGSPTNDNNEPVVAGLSDGSFVIVHDNDELNRMDVEHFSATGSSLGVFNFAGIGAAPAVTDLGDGRFAVTWQEATGEIAMEILDTRDFVNAGPVYVPDSWQVGTVNGDVFTTALGAEIVHGHAGDDTITEAGSGTVGGDPQVRIFGDGGDDTIVVTSNISGDIFNGGGGANPDGSDTIDWSAATVTGSGYYFDLEAGLAVDSPSFVDEMKNFQNLIGTNQDDTIVGNEGANIIDARGGDDVVRGRGNPDDLEGGAGIDTLSYEFALDAVAVNLATGLGTLGEAAGDMVSGFENIRGGDFADTLTGDGQANGLEGGLGNDILRDGAGGDTLLGGDGDDTFRLDADGASDTVAGEAGAADVLDLVFATSAATVTFGATAFAGTASGGGQGNTSFTGIERILGSSFGDTLGGGGGAELLIGNGGVDSIAGSGGNDSITGNGGDDKLNDGAGTDYVSGGSDNDAISLAADGAADTIGGDVGTDALDVFFATGAATVVFGATAFAGTASGGGLGTNSFTGIERINGSTFGDTVSGGAGTEFFLGRAGADTLTGWAGSDTLRGDAGADRLAGVQGADTVFGGADADTFVFAHLAHGGDSFGDFATGIDDIEIARVGFGLAAGYALNFQVGAVASGAGQVFLFNPAGKQFLFDSNGAAAGGTTLLATLSAGSVAAGDIVLV